MNVKIPVYMHTFTYLCIFTVCKFALVCKNCTFTEIYKYVNLTRDVNLHDTVCKFTGVRPIIRQSDSPTVR